MEKENTNDNLLHWESDDHEIKVWVEQDQSVCIKAITKNGDPVEMSAEEACALAKILENFGKKADLD